MVRLEETLPLPAFLLASHRARAACIPVRLERSLAPAREAELHANRRALVVLGHVDLHRRWIELATPEELAVLRVDLVQEHPDQHLSDLVAPVRARIVGEISRDPVE